MISAISDAISGISYLIKMALLQNEENLFSFQKIL